MLDILKPTHDIFEKYVVEASAKHVMLDIHIIIIPLTGIKEATATYPCTASQPKIGRSPSAKQPTFPSQQRTAKGLAIRQFHTCFHPRRKSRSYHGSSTVSGRRRSGDGKEYTVLR